MSDDAYNSRENTYRKYKEMKLKVKPLALALFKASSTHAHKAALPDSDTHQLCLLWPITEGAKLAQEQACFVS